MDEFVAELAAKGLLTPEAARRVAELDARERLPLARELHALLYLGAALILAGVGATVKDRLDQIGPATILAVLGLGAAACLGDCFRRSPPFAPGRVAAPTAAFDYVLYLGCGLVGIFFSYLEWKWKLLGSWWDLYLFGSGLLFAALAYRFDNRLVLATGLMNLAAWLGLRTSRWDPFDAMGRGGSMDGLTTRLALTAYGVVLFGLGAAARKGELKPHFADTYITLGVHLALMALLSDALRFSAPQFWTLMVACAALGVWSMRERRFDTFAAAVGYAYISVLSSLLHAVGWNDFNTGLWTIIISSGSVLAALLWARARFREAVS